MAMASMWSEGETSKLINLWGDDVIQAQLEGCKRNREVFEKISRGMVEANYQRSVNIRAEDRDAMSSSSYIPKTNNTSFGYCLHSTNHALDINLRAYYIRAGLYHGLQCKHGPARL